jgi:hypothetical protein
MSARYGVSGAVQLSDRRSIFDDAMWRGDALLKVIEGIFLSRFGGSLAWQGLDLGGSRFARDP